MNQMEHINYNIITINEMINFYNVLYICVNRQAPHNIIIKVIGCLINNIDYKIINNVNHDGFLRDKISNYQRIKVILTNHDENDLKVQKIKELLAYL